MSFHRIDMLPAFDAEKRNRQRARWSEADDGAKTELLTHMGMFDQLLYVSSAFAGVSLVALFITVMANLLLKET
jgi:hypothetical protein